MLDEFKHAFQRPNNAHVQLIIINVVVFLVLAVLFVFSKIGDMENLFTTIHNHFLIPPRITDFITRPWTILTYAFAHSLTDLFHILFNMLALYWFGKLFIEYLGSDKLLALYLLGALAAGTMYLLLFNTVPFFVQRSGFDGMVGASGSVFAIMVAAARPCSPTICFSVVFWSGKDQIHRSVFSLLPLFSDRLDRTPEETSPTSEAP